MLFALADIAGWIARKLEIFRGMLDPSSFLFYDLKLWSIFCVSQVTFLNIESHLQLFVSVAFQIQPQLHLSICNLSFQFPL